MPREIFFRTSAHEVTFDTLDSLPQAVHPGSDLLREFFSSIFSRPVGFFSPLRIFKFALRKRRWTRK